MTVTAFDGEALKIIHKNVNSWNIWKGLVAYLTGECSANLGLLSCLGRSISSYLKGGMGSWGPCILGSLLDLFSKFWKVKKLPPFASHLFLCSAQALKIQSTEPSVVHRTEGAGGSPVQRSSTCQVSADLRGRPGSPAKQHLSLWPSTKQKQTTL